MKSIQCLLAFFLLFCARLHAQNEVVVVRSTAGTATCTGIVYEYRSASGALAEWRVQGGYIVEQTSTIVKVQWTSSSGSITGKKTVSIRVCFPPDPPCANEIHDYYGTLAVTNIGSFSMGLLPASPVTVCPRQDIVLSASGTATSYSWSGAGIDGASGSTVTIRQQNEGTYFYSVSGTMGGCVGTQSITVTVKSNSPSKPVAPSVSDNPCGNKMLHSVSGSGDPAISWYWQPSGPDGTNLSLPAMADYEATTSGTYYLRAYSVTCGWSVESAAVTVNVNRRIDCQNLNYIVTSTIEIPGVTESTDISALSAKSVDQVVDYFDGLCRPVQNVIKQGSPKQYDITVPVVYDEVGRAAVQYLPYVSANPYGWYDSSAVVPTSGYGASHQYMFYNNGDRDAVIDDSRPYTETIYEESPLNRPLKSYGPGQDWKDKEKVTKHDYLINSHGTDTGQEKIIFWDIAATGMLTKRTVRSGYVETGGYYSSGQLSIKQITDEEGHAIREYRDKDNHLVLKKVRMVDGASDLNSDNQWACTYYVYNNRGELVMVLPPEATRAAKTALNE